MSIAYDLVYLAAEEGEVVAIEAATILQDALETIAEIGSDDEVIAASFLLGNVNQGITEITEGTLMVLARDVVKKQLSN